MTVSKFTNNFFSVIDFVLFLRDTDKNSRLKALLYEITPVNHFGSFCFCNQFSSSCTKN